jgi:flagellar biosynthesis protein FliR
MNWKKVWHKTIDILDSILILDWIKSKRFWEVYRQIMIGIVIGAWAGIILLNFFFKGQFINFLK